MKSFIASVLLLVVCNASSSYQDVTSPVVTTSVGQGGPAVVLDVVSSVKTIPIEYSALTIPASDWFPPNPYCGKTASDFAFPIPPQCPTGQYINLSGPCATSARDNYTTNMVNLSNTCCAAYQQKVDMFQTLMDHYAQMLQSCISDCFQNETCVQECWDLNQAASANLFEQYDAQIASINNGYSIMAGLYRDMYQLEMQQCCEPLPEKIRR